MLVERSGYALNKILLLITSPVLIFYDTMPQNTELPKFNFLINEPTATFYKGPSSS